MYTKNKKNKNKKYFIKFFNVQIFNFLTTKKKIKLLKVSLLNLFHKYQIPIFDGIRESTQKLFQCFREFIFLNFHKFVQVGPAGLEPATDGL